MQPLEFFRGRSTDHHGPIHLLRTVFSVLGAHPPSMEFTYSQENHRVKSHG